MALAEVRLGTARGKEDALFVTVGTGVDWDVMVAIGYRDWAAMEEHSVEQIIERLLPRPGSLQRGSATALHHELESRSFGDTCGSQNPTQGHMAPAQSGSGRGLLRRLIRRRLDGTSRTETAGLLSSVRGGVPPRTTKWGGGQQDKASRNKCESALLTRVILSRCQA